MRAKIKWHDDVEGSDGWLDCKDYTIKLYVDNDGNEVLLQLIDGKHWAELHGWTVKGSYVTFTPIDVAKRDRMWAEFSKHYSNASNEYVKTIIRLSGGQID